MDHSVIGRRRASTGKFTGHKLPLLVLSCIDLCPKNTADTLRGVKPRTLVEE